MFNTVLSPIGSFADKLLMFRPKIRLRFKTIEQVFDEDEQTTIS
ncbi:hypothetical protein [Pedobacter segetis]|nr:hypothetical protein [Pedobacter segetis]